MKHSVLQRHNVYNFWMGLWLVGMILAGCTSTRTTIFEGESPTGVSYTVMTDSVGTDPALEKLVTPYRSQLQDKVNEVLGTATAKLTTGRPEGSLGKFATDAMLAAVAGRTEPVQVALTNNGGLRVPVQEGPITVGDIFELMPFENALLILTMNGTEIDTLAQQLARAGGEPVAGLSFIINDAKALDVRVDNEPVDPSRTYRVVTTDYMAGGGSRIDVLGSVQRREETGILLRQALMDYVRRQGTIRPVIEQRIKKATH